MKLQTITPFILGLCLLTATAQAEMITQGGFGSDGPTGESIPTPSSTKEAQQVYNALSVSADKLGNKEIATKDGSAISCTKPTKGMSGALYAGCELLLRANTKAVIRDHNKKTLKGDVTFTGDLAVKLLASLDVKSKALFKAYTKEAANISCISTPSVFKGTSCTIKDVVLSQWEVDASEIADFPEGK